MTSTFKKEALRFHSSLPKGKIRTALQKNIFNKYDLSLAYSPGVSEACIAIKKDFNKIYHYTNKGNFVAVITNGTSVLGLGNLGTYAAKPVMEGKAALFKKFAGIDSIDVEINEKNPKKFIEIVLKIAETWGGINLEDIKAPECFSIEKVLVKKLNIPVFHDDQHGTAIVTSAALVNALYLCKKTFLNIKIVINGAGAAALACIKLFVKIGVQKKNIIVCDSKGVIYKGRSCGMNKYKDALAINTKKRKLSDAMISADVFIGLSVRNSVSKLMIKSMSSKPIIFAMANPDPEILPKLVYQISSDAIVATGRSDFNNQINNFICFPYLFRGALDVRAIKINDKMKISSIRALAYLARKKPIKCYLKKHTQICCFSKKYIIPSIFDSRLIKEISVVVAKAALQTGVAQNKITDFEKYRKLLSILL